MMYILLCGYPPFCGGSDRAILNLISKGDFTFPESDWCHISLEAKELVKKLLDVDPASRISADDALQHPWFDRGKNNQKFLYHNPRNNKMTGPIDLISKFTRFTGLSRLKKIALTIVAQNISDESEVQELRNLFRTLDTNRDGVLDADEIRAGIEMISKTADHDITTTFWKEAEQMESLLHAIDTSGTGTIDYTEFLAACLHTYHYQHDDACKKAFKVLDRDADGRISADELRDIFAMAGGGPSDDQEVIQALQEADIDGNGSISYTEFVTLMTRIPSRSLLTLQGDDGIRLMQKNASRTNLISNQDDNDHLLNTSTDYYLNNGQASPSPQRSASNSSVTRTGLPISKEINQRTRSLLKLLDSTKNENDKEAETVENVEEVHDGSRLCYF
eukprot:GHVH01008965.1.p1 GENE.GHVH01008965.1~~GHVH01008965.1.p1  ORF type:complete len:390 (+),score=51.77 GHVH01008965.1:122-1291(+)